MDPKEQIRLEYLQKMENEFNIIKGIAEQIENEEYLQKDRGKSDQYTVQNWEDHGYIYIKNYIKNCETVDDCGKIVGHINNYNQKCMEKYKGHKDENSQNIIDDKKHVCTRLKIEWIKKIFELLIKEKKLYLKENLYLIQPFILH